MSKGIRHLNLNLNYMYMRPLDRREGRGYDSRAMMCVHAHIMHFNPSALLCSTVCSRRYTKPLTPEFQAAADKLAKQQAELDAHMAARKLDQARALGGPAGLAMHVQPVRPSSPNNRSPMAPQTP